MEHNELRHDVPITSIPLESKLDVGSSRVAVMNRIVANVIAALDELGSVE